MHFLPLMLGIVACADPAKAPTSASPDDSADTGPCGTWRTVGQPFTLTYCTGCHAAGREGEARHGATVDVDFDALASVQEHAAAITANASEGGPMPPGGGPTTAERARMLAWLACGAPGDEATLPHWDAPGAGVAEIWESRVTNEADTLRVERTVDGEVKEREWYRVSRDTAAFLRWEHYDTDGNVFRGESWNPPLPIWTASGGGAVIATTATLTEDGGTTTREEEWVISQGNAVDVDARAQDQSPQESVAVEAGGEAWGWQYSDEAGPVASWHTRGEHAQMLLRQEIAPPPTADTPFPVSSGMFWPDRVVSTAEAP